MTKNVELALLALLGGPLTLVAVALAMVFALVAGGWFGISVGGPLLAYGVLGAIGTSLWAGVVGSILSLFN